MPQDLAEIFAPQFRLGGAEWLERQSRDEVYVVVAELDGQPVGRVGLDFRHFDDPRTAYLWAAHVEPSFQGRGIGTALMGELERVALARDIDRIRLAVGKDNPRAFSLYQRLGYRPDGEETQRWSYPDEYGRTVPVVEECWTMELDLTGRRDHRWVYDISN
jgi:ribosomal protein S18 acetylase RimI-like enzyme